MKVAVAYNEPVKGNLDSEDVLEEVQLVSEGLKELGYVYALFPVASSGDFCLKLLQQLKEFGPDVVFNLVEAIGENQRFHPAMASLFEMAGYPYTGSPYDVLAATTDKAQAKAVMKAYSIPTPEWQLFRGRLGRITVPSPWFVKPAWEDASVGIDDSCIVYKEEVLRAKLPLMFEAHRGPILIEEYIEGREFNIALLDRPEGGPELFHLAELLFENWPEGKPRIINYAAKWVEDSHEYENTPRIFNPKGVDIEALKKIVLHAWELFNLQGYARADMRMDEKGRIYVLELNANPCIGPWSGYISAASEMGYSPAQVVKRILDSAIAKRPLIRSVRVMNKTDGCKT